MSLIPGFIPASGSSVRPFVDGATVHGGTLSGGNLPLSSTSHATKGKITFGTSAYDEVNNRLGVGTASPTKKLDVVGESRFSYAGSYGVGAEDCLIFDPKEAGFGLFHIIAGRVPGGGNAAATRGDNYLKWGYNLPGTSSYVAGDDSFGMNIENSYWTGSFRQGEFYFSAVSGDGVLSHRPFGITPHWDSHTVSASFGVNALAIGITESSVLIDFALTNTTQGFQRFAEQSYIAFTGTGLSAAGDFINGPSQKSLVGASASNTIAELGRGYDSVAICGYNSAAGEDVSLYFGTPSSIGLFWKFATTRLELGTAAGDYWPLKARKVDLRTNTGNHIRFGGPEDDIYTYVIQRIGSGYCNFSSAATGGITGYIFNTGDKTDAFKINADGNIGIGTPTFGTSSISVLAHKNGTAPSANVTDCYQQYAADQAAGNSCPHWRTENGSIVKLYKTGTYTPTNVTTDRAFDANSTSIDELADVVGTLIADIQATGIFG